MAKRGRKRRTIRLPPVLSRAGKTAMFLVLIALIGAAYAWHEGRDWRPDEELWPDQGALVSAGDGAVDFDTLAGLGAQFVYLEASDGAARKDAGFGPNFARARNAGLQVGAAHRFDPCAVADGQSGNFVTMVPRDAELLPPAILLNTCVLISTLTSGWHYLTDVLAGAAVAAISVALGAATAPWRDAGRPAT